MISNELIHEVIAMATIPKMERETFLIDWFEAAFSIALMSKAAGTVACATVTAKGLFNFIHKKIWPMGEFARAPWAATYT